MFFSVELGQRFKRNTAKKTFGYKKRFHSSAFMQDQLSSTLTGQLIKETMDKTNSFLPALCVSFNRV